MLIFPLKKEWYEKIKSGEKTVEYREVKDYWTKRLFPDIPEDLQGEPRRCYFQLGYKPETRLKAIIHKVEIVDGKNTDLKIDKPVYAIHFRLEEYKMTIESIVKSTMAKEIEEKLNQLDLLSLANKKLERYIKKFVKINMEECVRREVSFAVKQYIDSWQGKHEIAGVIASMIKVSVKEN